MHDSHTPGELKEEFKRPDIVALNSTFYCCVIDEADLGMDIPEYPDESPAD